MNYYNEHDPKAAEWLRELIKDGHISNGIVDQRDIQLVRPGDLREFVQCHFFAGIGGWSYALRLAGVADDEPVGTGSCPCQPFSAAGNQLGEQDERHLWPAFFKLIVSCRDAGQLWTAKIFGEQVASKVALGWLDGVCADLEGAGYAVGAADLCAAGVGAPMSGQRLYWMATPTRERSSPRLSESFPRETRDSNFAFNPSSKRVWDIYEERIGKSGSRFRVEPSICLLDNGIPNRVAKLRGFGNAIVPQAAAQFILACEEVLKCSEISLAE